MAFWRAELIKVLARLKELEAGLPGSYQPLDPDLTAIAALSTTAYGRTFLTFADEAGFKAAVNLEAGVDYQAYDADLASWASVTRASGFDTFVATPTSANLLALLTDETGSGAAVFATSPTLVTPALGVATATSINKVAITAPATGATITIPDGVTLTGPAGSGTAMTLGNAETVSGVKTFSAIPVLSGGAVSFPATQVPSGGANDLDDYEEGTFTPAFAATGATFSYALQTGFYTKIGRMVFFAVDFQLNTSGNTLTANALTVTGLPFTASGSNGSGVFQVRWTGSTTSYVSLFVRVAGTTLVVESLTAAATTLGVAVANGALHATNGTTFRVIGSYYV